MNVPAPEAAPPSAPIPPQPPRPPRAPPGDARGSLGLGIGLAWACLIGGYTVVGALVTLLAQASMPYDARNAIAIGAVFLPWVLMVGLIIWFATIGLTRTAAGIGIGIASIVGVTLLLVAACFGLLAGTNFH